MPSCDWGGMGRRTGMPVIVASIGDSTGICVQLPMPPINLPYQ
jgi:hypothetical protein